MNKPFLIFLYEQWIVVAWSGICHGFDLSWGTYYTADVKLQLYNRTADVGFYFLLSFLCVD